eukprot:GEMP01051964.1.p1 GENE.GEMP01051964.1~~GEMP01051964.1.p1  ORF type:complete len:132 (+),score=27.27 GEMP01051964.1:95-490(+)
MTAFDRIAGLTPALRNSYWREVISREHRGHVSHCLNSKPQDFKTLCGKDVGKEDFYEGVWDAAQCRYHQAAGAPTAFLKMVHAKQALRERARNQRSSSEAPGVRMNSVRSSARSSIHPSARSISASPACRA